MNLNQSCFENQEPDESWEFMFEPYKKCNPNPTETKEQKPKPRNEARKEACKSAAQDKNSAADAYLEDLASRILDMLQDMTLTPLVQAVLVSLLSQLL